MSIEVIINPGGVTETIIGIPGPQGPEGPQGPPGVSVPAEFGSGDPINVDYSAAKGVDLFTNGTGLLGNSYNMSAAFTFDPVITPGLPGSFRYDGYHETIQYQSEFLPVNPNLVYQISAYIRQESMPGDWSAYTYGERHQQYMGVACYDVDKKFIRPDDHMRYRHNGIDSLTTLTQPLTPGDTAIYVADAGGWNETDTSIFRRGIIIFEYKNALGYKYDYYSQIWGRELFDITGVDKVANVINLNQPFPSSLGNPDDPNGTWPVGTRIANQNSGGYKYSVYAGLIVPAVDKWYRVLNYMGGIDISGNNVAANFPPGTAYAKLFWMPNYSNRAVGYNIYPDTGPDHSFWVGGVSIFPEPLGLAIANADGSKTLKVPKANAAAGQVDIVDQALVVEEV